MTKNGVLYTYSGTIAFPDGAPTLLDIAISLSREGRYAGAGVRFWPVALHTFVVCDMLPDKLKFDGLLHDAAESVIGDVPKPVKTAEIEEFENYILATIYKSFGVTVPNPKEHASVKVADNYALFGEVYTVGNQALKTVLPRCVLAEEIVLKYAEKYKHKDYLEPTGKVPLEFIHRFNKYKDLLPKRRLLK